jgi:hypothetical protein
MNKILFIDSLRTAFLPWNDNLHWKFQSEGPILLFLDRHASHVTPRVLSYASSQRILIIQLVAHLLHISQRPDLCVFGIFKFLCKKENKMKGMKEETLKICPVIAAFYKGARIPMVRWSFVGARFRLYPTIYLLL